MTSFLKNFKIIKNIITFKTLFKNKNSLKSYKIVNNHKSESNFNLVLF